MTPLSRMLGRMLPKALVAPALTLLYAVMMLAIFVTSSNDRPSIIYQDVRAR